MSVPATTVNKVCLSGLNAIYLADLMINAGEADIVVAGGMESMTQAPYLLPGARAGYRIGDGTLVDSMMYDGLFCAFDHCAMGSRHRALQRRRRSVPRAPGRLQRPLPRAGRGRHQGRQVRRRDRPGQVPQRKGDPLVVDTDEGVRPETTAESLGKLRPAFDKNGTITAGNASQISDGGAAVIVMSKAKAEELGVTPLGELVSYGRWPGRTRRCSTSRPTPSGGLAKAGLDLGATSTSSRSTRPSPPSGCASADDLGISEDMVNVNGGAIALGHPVGHVRHPAGPHRAARAQAPRRRHRGRQPLRRRRPGRRRHPAHPADLPPGDAQRRQSRPRATRPRSQPGYRRCDGPWLRFPTRQQHTRRDG